ncbi:MAG TPA: tetratricopeptide repeat protein [Bdellovibrionota bacterium]|nr:tetratricopeptide repeat protein [Bdellovibrionota bacterium]
MSLMRFMSPMNPRKLNRSMLLFLLLALTLLNSACLKTRAQLKEDSSSDDVSNPVPAKVQDVQPQGQYIIDEIKGELTRLTGRIEDLERNDKQQAANSSIAGKEDVKKLEARIAELEQAQAAILESIKKAEATNTADPSELFERGKQQFEAGNHEGAIESFTAYLKGPKQKPSAESATFMRAEAYYQLKQFKKAIVDYSKFPEKFTTSKKMPVALLKIGQSFDALGMRDDAKSFYQELIEKFPKSQEAKKARAKLK